MKIDDVRRTAYSMPLTNPSFPPGPYRFFNREYFVITYRTDPEALAAVVPEPLEVTEPVVKYEFIRMPDSTGFGDYTETGQVIPVRLNGEEGAYTHAMYLDDDAPIAGGRELWGFPKKRATPKIEVESDVLVGSLHYGSVLCVSATMGYKHRPVDHDAVLNRAGSIAFRDGFARAGQRVIIVAGVPLGSPGATNMLRIAYVGPDGDADM